MNSLLHYLAEKYSEKYWTGIYLLSLVESCRFCKINGLRHMTEVPENQPYCKKSECYQALMPNGWAEKYG